MYALNYSISFTVAEVDPNDDIRELEQQTGASEDEDNFEMLVAIPYDFIHVGSVMFLAGWYSSFMLLKCPV